MHAVIQGTPSDVTTITVNSPQFAEGTWKFSAELTGAFAYRAKSLHYNIEITIYSDDAFHSQDPEELAKNPTKIFHNHKEPISKVPKTGLGSSAALVSVVTAAILSFYKPELTKDFTVNRTSLDRIHFLAQLAHCAAQKKIGSGFDVASAVFGSIIYRRFVASTLGDLTSFENYEGLEYAKLVQTLIDSTDWGLRTDPIGLPAGFSLLMGDISGGSETPKMVSTVLQWRKENPERSLEVWTDLNNANMELVSLLDNFTKLYESSPELYNAMVEKAKGASGAELSNSDGLLKELANSFTNIRKGLKTMTLESGAPIEPDSQTAILDESTKLTGVIGGVVPGAGGYDAVCLLVATDSVESIKKQAATNPVLQHVNWLKLHQENVGLTCESLEQYV
ncbi:hypothetical protein D0Z00_000340 [Geotrichum galactomycetum]|uniref:Uncharacterized protein n=1 Tax=Geotrichum galactomycetum TaxID=27317 RepID=A0ACB6VA87_9ASCO|nr:hypothetical protein D0Z00_000340 [Geotrichum candidum]